MSKWWHFISSLEIEIFLWKMLKSLNGLFFMKIQEQIFKIIFFWKKNVCKFSDKEINLIIRVASILKVQSQTLNMIIIDFWNICLAKYLSWVEKLICLEVRKKILRNLYFLKYLKKSNNLKLYVYLLAQTLVAS